MKKIIKDIYIKSPVWFQNTIISVYGYQLMKQRYGTVYKDTFKALISKQYDQYDLAVKEQNELLVIFLNYAVNHSPFYKELYKDIDIRTITNIDDLKVLPIVDKEDFRAHIEDVYTIEKDKGINSFTGGTTGKSLEVRFDKEDMERRMAYLDAFKYRAGIKDPFKVRKATFSGRDLIHNSNTKIFWRYNAAYKQRLYSTFHLSEDNIPLYVADMNKFKPEVINGFVSAIYELAHFIHRNKISLSFVPKAIFTTSETLLPFHRSLIEDVFNAKIYNQYASAEGAPFITECVQGNLHYNLDTGVIETSNSLNGIEDNQMIVTSFTTKGTPLIRYNIEDLVHFEEGVCSCGSCHPIVFRIEGRKVEYLLSGMNGKISLSHLADVIKGIPNSVKKIQFIQDEINKIKIKIAIDKDLFEKDHEDKILKEMVYRFGASTQFHVQYVEDIPREKSGKYALIKNTMNSKKPTP